MGLPGDVATQTVCVGFTVVRIGARGIHTIHTHTLYGMVHGGDRREITAEQDRGVAPVWKVREGGCLGMCPVVQHV